MPASARTDSVLRRFFSAHVALGVAFVVLLSALGAFFATNGSATPPSQELKVVAAPAAPPTAVPSIAPKVVVTTAKPKVPTKVAPKVVYRSTAPRPAYHPVAVHFTPAAGGSQMKAALIIGVGNPVGAQALPGADADAQNERAALIKYGYPAGNIQMLIDGQATRNNIIAALHSLASRTNRNGTAFFGVSTHSSQSSFRTYEGNRIQRSEIASLLGHVPGHVVSVFAVCFADSYNTPGVTGPNRIAVFSSAGGEETWESSAGSDFVRGMVKEGMLEDKESSRSVESAFNYARAEMQHNGTGHPSMNDQIPGNFAL